MSTVAEESWTSWQSLGRNGPSRWSSDHYTRDGDKTLCGIRIPVAPYVFQRGRGEGGNECPTCVRKLNEHS
jgi:hypothetical protein